MYSGVECRARFGHGAMMWLVHASCTRADSRCAAVGTRNARHMSKNRQLQHGEWYGRSRSKRGNSAKSLSPPPPLNLAATIADGLQQVIVDTWYMKCTGIYMSFQDIPMVLVSLLPVLRTIHTRPQQDISRHELHLDIYEEYTLWYSSTTPVYYCSIFILSAPEAPKSSAAVV